MTEVKQPKEKSIGKMTLPALEEDLAYCQRALRNAKLRPLSVAHYRRRQDLLEAELIKRRKR